jgi:hypothetical protein
MEPCPFCRNNSDLGIGRGTEDREGYPTYVYCGECGAQGPWGYTRDKAIWTCMAVACEETGWNRRDDTLTEAVRWYLETIDMHTSDAMQTWDAMQETLNGVWAARDELRRLVGDA